MIRVEYEAYETLLTPDAVLDPGAREIHRGSPNMVGEHAFECGGDIQWAFRESDYLIEADYRTQLVQHCHLENHCALAYMEDRERITIVTSTQIPQIVRRIVGEALCIPWHRIRIIKPHVGGGFGNKQDAVLEPLAAFLTLKLGGQGRSDFVKPGGVHGLHPEPASLPYPYDHRGQKRWDAYGKPDERDFHYRCICLSRPFRRRRRKCQSLFPVSPRCHGLPGPDHLCQHAGGRSHAGLWRSPDPLCYGVQCGGCRATNRHGFRFIPSKKMLPFWGTSTPFHDCPC